jgi:pyruvate carboxylase
VTLILFHQVGVQGELGQPPYGFPEPLRTRVLRGRTPLAGRPGADTPPVDFDKMKATMEKKYERKIR